MKSLILPEINKKTIVGQLASQEYENFATVLEESDNEADLYYKAECTLSQNIETCKDIKRVVSLEQKSLENFALKIRDNMARYMSECKIKKLHGTKLKSITLQEAKETERALIVKQIKLGRKYVDLKEISKEELVDILEKFGVQTRIISKIETVENKINIRVIK